VQIPFSFVARAQEGEIKITTASKEALELFNQGLAKWDNLHIQAAEELFNKAVAKDKDFAMAHCYLAWIAGSEKDRIDHLNKAVALADKFTKGERLLILSSQAFYEDNPKKAQELLEQLVTLHPKDKRAHQFCPSLQPVGLLLFGAGEVRRSG
jgi:tetratricopeptide (TPR) repeat protein